jgi:aspartate/methionine/tyrosine aminotransferase
MSSATIERVLRLHDENALLRSAVLPPVSTHDGDLSADDLIVPLDERVIAAAVDALESGQTHYVDVPGIAPLRQAVAAYLSAQTGANYQQPNVIVTAGIQESRFLTIQMIGESFGRIALPAVGHPGVRKAVGVRAMQTDVIPVDPATMLAAVDGVRAALQAGARLLYLESPSRLTGAAYTAEQVAALAALARDYTATILWDQGLSPWAAAYTSLGSQPDMLEHAALIGEAFPGMGLSSWLIGYIAAPEALVPPMQSQKQIMAICTSTAAQYAALESSRLYAESLPSQVARLAAKRDQIAAAVSGAEVMPGSTATVLALRFALDAKAAALAKLIAAGFSAADGADFGAPDILRLTISHSDAAERAVQQLAK